jgi:repressor LexA
MTAHLTEKQRAIYEFIVERVDRRGIPPTLNEIGTAVGLSSASGVADHLNALQRKGYIRRRPGISRGIELLVSQRHRRTGEWPIPAAVRIPVLGAIPAPGRLSPARPTGRYLVVDQRVMPGATVAVRAELGDLGAYGIRAGDFLILGKSPALRPGDLAVARVRNYTTLVEVISARGRVRRIDNRAELHDGYEILGNVLAVLRSMNGMDEEEASQ